MMKIVCISDTHSQHHVMEIPFGDILIHAGDVSKRGSKEEVLDFLHWFSQQPHRYKICIAGNHDWFFEKHANQIQTYIPDNIIYLNDTGIEIEGLNIWGSPIQPTFYNWAFNRDRGESIKRHWDMIPQNIDVLITHGPPFGMLDQIDNGDHVGCKALLNKVNTVQPLYHIFGHIHEGYGINNAKNTTFINASLLTEKYVYKNKPIEINLLKKS